MIMTLKCLNETDIIESKQFFECEVITYEYTRSTIGKA